MRTRLHGEHGVYGRGLATVMDVLGGVHLLDRLVAEADE